MENALTCSVFYPACSILAFCATGHALHFPRHSAAEMVLAAGFTSTSDVVFLFAGAGIVLYAASRAAADALTTCENPSPGRMAFAQWMPIALTAILATGAGRSDIGIGVLFATSVAILALVLGILLCVTPVPAGVGPSSTAWPFIVPAALVVLLAGFSATLTWWHACMLLALGVAVLGVWRTRRETTAAVVAMSGEPRGTRALQFILSLALGGVGAWLAYKATTVTNQQTRVATGGLIALAVLSPLLALPIIGTTANISHHGRTGVAVSAIAALVLLNLLLLLPLVIFTYYIRQLTLAWIAGSRTFEAIQDVLNPVPFPLAVWRVDTVLLLVLGLMLIPVSLGKWSLRRTEGLLLAFVYATYLIISTWIAIRV